MMLWSREPWELVDDVGINSMPTGRFVSGGTKTSLGTVTVIGVRIPWFGSRTEARRKLERKMRWEDHGQYLVDLTKVLEGGSANRLLSRSRIRALPGGRRSGLRHPLGGHPRLQSARNRGNPSASGNTHPVTHGVPHPDANTGTHAPRDPG